MNRFALFFALFFALSCHGNKPSLTDNKPVEAADFFAAFHKLKLPYNAADTSLADISDTTSISFDVLQQFIPDSALTLLSSKKNVPLVIHPVGKIENKTELYLLMTGKAGKKTSLLCFLFDNSKKKKVYLNHLLLLSNQNNDGYIHSVDINTEPTFTITKNKTTNGQYSYTKNGYAYSKEAKSFIEVINESNENVKKNNDIMNPIDTLKKTFKFSGDYVKDKTNFISVRDGNIGGKYSFFLHFEKKNDDCNGELKGTLTMVDATKAVFEQSGDPCVIDFTFTGSNIKVKERGSCGNHRGITCLFDDSYRKKKEGRPQPLKGSLKTR